MTTAPDAVPAGVPRFTVTEIRTEITVCPLEADWPVIPRAGRQPALRPDRLVITQTNTHRPIAYVAVYGVNIRADGTPGARAVVGYSVRSEWQPTDVPDWIIGIADQVVPA